MDRSTEIEAILFAHGAPMTRAAILRALDMTDEEFAAAVAALRTRLSGGIRLIEAGDSFQLGTAPELADLVAAVVGADEDGELSRAAAETLALVLYSGPITKQSIDYVRGVNSVYILRNLMIRGLIEKSADTRNKRVAMYEPSFALLSKLGVTNINELPDCESLRTTLYTALNERTDAA